MPGRCVDAGRHFLLRFHTIHVHKWRSCVTTKKNNIMVDYIKIADLFCGMGGFHLGISQACHDHQKTNECVFASDIDKFACQTYDANFSIKPKGDITKI